MSVFLTAKRLPHRAASASSTSTGGGADIEERTQRREKERKGTAGSNSGEEKEHLSALTQTTVNRQSVSANRLSFVAVACFSLEEVEEAKRISA